MAPARWPIRLEDLIVSGIFDRFSREVTVVSPAQRPRGPGAARTAPSSRREGPRAAEWLSPREASRLLGVSAATLRRWGDAGQIATFTTPGGHRRFSRSSLRRLLPTARPGRPRLADLGETPSQMMRGYRRHAAGTTPPPSWLSALPEPERAVLRDHGRRLAASLLRAIDAPAPEEREAWMATAEADARGYGALARRHGLSLSATVELFLRFRAPFTGELAALCRRAGLDTDAATDLLAQATQALDRLLVATIRGHASAAGSGR